MQFNSDHPGRWTLLDIIARFVNTNLNVVLIAARLLYAVFVALSEQATVADLAQTLQADLSQLEAAVSLASRLGWAKKVMDPAALLNDLHLPGSPNSEGSVADDGFGNTRSVPASPFQEGLSEADGDIMRPQSGVTRFALMVDANLTSYLMMGSLSPGHL